ncbi:MULTISPECIES: low molecular weight protein-tyrosine-phosphatase [Paraburkholderia]|uniref:protein-tyrosine-phosphatase n=1 Tax=Paraburkholderia madseniana TaxID=2599607 RepID=A0AAP5EQM2_9BURK|nr:MULTISPECIES: low molecular weight protein-tyrosine-phosphatase [Paraburkholderia]MCX4149281.1 low molecular weight phosphotyrosine protein phosphatase [Paraburkholderia madseniana]MDN7152216.1 low molecular weight phosphotyrosine protein phosphatase [Paraburkholderia sp. WS6]MDQ6411098.1 low molecular weight phosphotyrosine protein phosphatase [Paraburkholderia madseniana]
MSQVDGLDRGLIVVVCTANLCRSPMAEKVMRKLIEEWGVNFSVVSRGLHCVSGKPVHLHAGDLLVAKGHKDVDRLKSEKISRSDMREADLVLVMERNQRAELINLYPESSGKIWLLGHWIGREILDPYGRGKTEFTRTLSLIEEACASWCKPLKNLNG